MLTGLFQLLGGNAQNGGKVVDTVLVLRNASHSGWAVLAAIVLGAGVVWSYRHSSEVLPARRKYALAALRIGLVLLMLLLLLQPVLRVRTEGSIRRAMVFLIDTTASMKIEDPRTEDADIKRAAIALDRLDPSRGLAQKLDAESAKMAAHPSRTCLLQGALRSAHLALLPRLSKTFDLRAFGMGQTVTDLLSANSSTQPATAISTKNPDPTAWVDSIGNNSPVTPLGDALRDVLSRSRGQPLAGIFLATDGQSNTGSAPLAAAELAKAEGVPLFIYGVGLPNPKDIAVASVFAQEICFIRDQVPVTVRLRGVGLEGQKASVVLKLGDDRVDVKEVIFDGSEQIVQMKFTPEKAGESIVTASIEPRNDEAVKDNNSTSQRLKVIDGKIKVLFLDTSPRWEFKYLQAMLLRDRRVDAKFVLQESSAAVSAIEGGPYLKEFPKVKQDLIEKFDLLILGDVDLKTLSAEQVANIGEFVSKFGGGLLVVPGKRFGLETMRGGPVEKMLPVDLSKERDLSAGPSNDNNDRAIRIDLTPAGQRSPMLRLSDDEQESPRLWAKLPPVFWEQPVDRAKPAADVLAVDADATHSPRPGSKLPVIAMQQYGLGQVLYVGTDNIWRWRKNIGDKYYTMLWGQMMQRLALPHLLGESKRTQLSTEKKSYSTGERVAIYARLYDEGFSPRTDSKVEGSYSVNGSNIPVQLRPLPDQPGMFRGEFVATVPGDYTFKVAADEKSKLEFQVTEPRLEMGETSMNEPLLRQMALTSGGTFYREEDLFKLPDAVGNSAEVMRSTLEIDLWSSPIFFLLLVGLAVVEWMLRKWWQLK